MKQSQNSNPTLIARETLKQLALLKIPPTPDNYRKLYSQISGGADDSKSPPTISQELPAEERTGESEVVWGETIEILLKQLANKQGTLTIAKKREGVNRVLAKFSKDSRQLHDKLRALVESWGLSAVATPETAADAQAEGVTETESNPPDTGGIEKNAEGKQLTGQILELLAQLLRGFVANQLKDTALVEETKLLAQRIRTADSKQAMEQLAADFRQLCGKFDVYGGSDDRLQRGLLKLLNMLMDSTGELLAEDQWIGLQLNKLRETISKPLDLQVLEQAEQYLEEITQRQETVKRSLAEAKLTLKQMIAALITNIDELSDTTGEYQDKLEEYSNKISKTDDINELNQLLGLIMEETRQMQKSALNYRNDFLAAQAEVSLAQNKINQLEAELHQMGEKVHEDHLTGILNRRGLDSAFEREAARSARHQASLCFALLDIDNFKQLNDTHGHKVGDDALVYLVESIKETTRPEDVVSRYGGEEFVILLPNTRIDEAIQVLSRIRRSLTKKFFLNENKRILITFSAGVAQLQAGESQENIFKRADDALYSAKKGGKNQIVTAELPSV